VKLYATREAPALWELKAKYSVWKQLGLMRAPVGAKPQPNKFFRYQNKALADDMTRDQRREQSYD